MSTTLRAAISPPAAAAPASAAAASVALEQVALVAIARNEGERLRRCLESAANRVALVVYVDSGSTDGSVDVARSLGAQVVSLDMSQPFTAARARNAGFAEVMARLPSTQFVQFVDGDCEVVAGWLAIAERYLREHADVAAVAGRRRERFPEHSVYNLLCDLDWNSPPGEGRYFGGDVMLRAEALRAVGGYREHLIAGEEPDLAIRLRAKAWRIWHLPEPMTLHDAAILRFGQWWKRSERTGYAYAEGVKMHGAPPERHWVRASWSAWGWGLALPILIAAAALLGGPIWLLGVLLYPLQALRLYATLQTTGMARFYRAVFLVIGKFPEALGQLRYLWRRASHGQQRLIEYK